MLLGAYTWKKPNIWPLDTCGLTLTLSSLIISAPNDVVCGPRARSEIFLRPTL